MGTISSWRDYSAWLTAFPDTVPENLTSPREIAAWEAECFNEQYGGSGPSLYPVPDDAQGEHYFLEQSGDGRIVIHGGEPGILYGTYEAILDLVCGRPLPCGVQAPAYRMRMLDSWDNMDGSIERGYAGRSLWFEGGIFSYEPARIR